MHLDTTWSGEHQQLLRPVHIDVVAGAGFTNLRDRIKKFAEDGNHAERRLIVYGGNCLGYKKVPQAGEIDELATVLDSCSTRHIIGFSAVKGGSVYSPGHVGPAFDEHYKMVHERCKDAGLMTWWDEHWLEFIVESVRRP